MRFYLPVLFALLSAAVQAQVTLKPGIGIGPLPTPTTAICSIPTFQGNFATSGYRVGDTIPDFTLYTLSGNPVNMATVLQSKKPVLLIAGSYTCPVYRGKVADLNAMAAFYGSQLNVYIIYTVEAHPNTDPSPYSGTIWVTSQNTSAGILFPQPTTYGQRKAMVDTMKAHMSITPTVLLDGPCNEWWNHFGPAPNNAYLIDTNGRVRAKNGWYNKLPDNMWCSIDTLLGTSSGKCINGPSTANFSFHLTEDSIVTGVAGTVLTIHGMLKNTSATSGATVNIQKIQKNLPVGWESALCTDVCLNTNVDATSVIIPPADSQSFIFYFYTNSTGSSGNVTIGFSNPSNANNKMKQGYYAVTNTLGLPGTVAAEHRLIVYPNPATSEVHLQTGYGNHTGSPNIPSADVQSISIQDLQGRQLLLASTYSPTQGIDVRSLAPGLYVIRLVAKQGTRTQMFRKE